MNVKTLKLRNIRRVYRNIRFVHILLCLILTFLNLLADPLEPFWAEERGISICYCTWYLILSSLMNNPL